MILHQLVPAATVPVSLDDAKAHSRVEVDDEDALIDGLILAATEYAEWYTQRALLSQEWELLLDDFPRDRRWFEVPRPPFGQLATDITYLDTLGNEQTFEAAEYRLVVPGGPMAAKARIVLKPSKVWPLTRAEPGSVTVRFQAGYGDYPDAVPEAIRTAIKVHVAELYENRENTVLTGAALQQVPFGVNALLWPYRVDKLGF